MIMYPIRFRMYLVIQAQSLLRLENKGRREARPLLPNRFGLGTDYSAMVAYRIACEKPQKESCS